MRELQANGGVGEASAAISAPTGRYLSTPPRAGFSFALHSAGRDLNLLADRAEGHGRGGSSSPSVHCCASRSFRRRREGR